jgi:hypothetical protein
MNKSSRRFAFMLNSASGICILDKYLQPLCGIRFSFAMLIRATVRSRIMLRREFAYLANWTGKNRTSVRDLTARLHVLWRDKSSRRQFLQLINQQLQFARCKCQFSILENCIISSCTGPMHTQLWWGNHSILTMKNKTQTLNATQHIKKLMNETVILHPWTWISDRFRDGRETESEEKSTCVKQSQPRCRLSVLSAGRTFFSSLLHCAFLHSSDGGGDFSTQFETQQQLVN